MPPILRLEHVTFAYPPPPGGEPPPPALDDVSLTVAAGEYVVVLGHNGSGKSTLAKHLNALLLPSAGAVYVQEWNTRDPAHTLDIRRTVGMVFQHPDNQIVATIVEEDVAFGPENLGVPRPELLQRVDWALDLVEMQAYRSRGPHQLSGGQKQRVCIAGVLAMQPQVLVLDEATAMLDPLGRGEVLGVARRLNREQGVTVVAVTHFMAEALEADRVVVMEKGRIALEGPPRAVFQMGARLAALHLDLPPVAALSAALHARRASFPEGLLTPEELTEALTAALTGASAAAPAAAPVAAPVPTVAPTEASPATPAAALTAAPTAAAPTPLPPEDSAPLITVTNLAHYYMRGTPLEVQALMDINLSVRRGEILGVLGHTGSGKSTAIQHLNGLLRPHGGAVSVFGRDMADSRVDLRAVRRRVGLVFQLPEAQLFEQYVGDDVAYGPRKLNLPREEVRARVQRAMEAVGLGFEEFKDRLTFRLSGGQMRRVALAGVLALEPEVLVLDEPTAGLDPEARRQLMAHILALRARGMTLVIISHNMEEMAAICDRLVVIAGGRTVLEGTPATVFSQAAELRRLGLDVPIVTGVVGGLVAAGLLPPTTPTVTTVAEAVAVLSGALA
jgi:energy-coupling factor transport system ATP-binding protein